MMENTSGIRPVAFNVLVRPDVVEEKTKGGLFLPEQAKEREEFGRTEGVLVDISPGAFTENYYGWPEDGMRPKVGDRVMFSKYKANEVTGKDHAKYWLMMDRDIAAVVAA